MSYQPKTHYDAVDKIWSSEKEKSQFGEDLSIGEIIFQEMVRHPKSVAQVSDSEKTILLREDLLNNAIRIATFMRNLDLTQRDIAIIGTNKEGEVCINKGSFWPGYYGNPEATKEIYKDNWLHSGDLGYVDNDGFLYVVERKKDLLKYQSNYYYPHELEELISRMPGVAEVCAFGIWGVENGDEAAATVVRKPNDLISEKDVEDYVAQNAGTEFLRLHAGCLIVDDLRRSPNGKTNRAANKEYFLQAKGIQIIT
uniref:Luciferin 4-monooxygenase-like n=1 Tax=Drosophila rhopaloa TaxID=1041015 RepID=A0A6P4EJD4_DRORH